MEISIGSKADVKSILPLTKQLQQLHMAGNGLVFKKFSKRKVTTFFEKNMDDGRATLVLAREGKKTTGYAFVVEHVQREGTFTHPRRFIVLEQVVVASDFQNQGLGRELTLRAKQIAVNKGYAKMELGVWGFNEVARKLFVSCGFSPMLINMQAYLP